MNTDERGADGRLKQKGREHKTVKHVCKDRAWARDDDGDGVREVLVNTIEGLWTGLRDYLRVFRGVSKWYLDQYVAILEWCHNLKRVTDEFLRLLLGHGPSTDGWTWAKVRTRRVFRVHLRHV